MRGRTLGWDVREAFTESRGQQWWWMMGHTQRVWKVHQTDPSLGLGSHIPPQSDLHVHISLALLHPVTLRLDYLGSGCFALSVRSSFHIQYALRHCPSFLSPFSQPSLIAQPTPIWLQPLPLFQCSKSLMTSSFLNPKDSFWSLCSLVYLRHLTVRLLKINYLFSFNDTALVIFLASPWWLLVRILSSILSLCPFAEAWHWSSFIPRHSSLLTLHMTTSQYSLGSDSQFCANIL